MKIIHTRKYTIAQLKYNNDDRSVPIFAQELILSVKYRQFTVTKL